MAQKMADMQQQINDLTSEMEQLKQTRQTVKKDQ